MALESRLIRICFTARLSAMMSGRSADTRQTRSMPASRARKAIRSQHVPITGPVLNFAVRGIAFHRGGLRIPLCALALAAIERAAAHFDPDELGGTFGTLSCFAPDAKLN